MNCRVLTNLPSEVARPLSSSPLKAAKKEERPPGTLDLWFWLMRTL
jgi:hypothetical protein